jgi:hypothetical protein
MRILSTVLSLSAVSLSRAAWQEYNETVSLDLFYYSAACYCEVDTIANWTCGDACTNNTAVKTVRIAEDYLEGTMALIAYNEAQNAIVVAFRGSHNYANWMFDIDYFLEPYNEGPPGAQVHTGFYDSYLSL